MSEFVRKRPIATIQHPFSMPRCGHQRRHSPRQQGTCPLVNSRRGNLTDLNPLTLEQSLQSALRDIGTNRCIADAENLAQSQSARLPVSIHLRRADIDEDGATRIARALNALSNVERTRLRSFSMSYNRIGDDGALALAASLPETLGELGLVGCSIGDDGGEAILNWASNASGLRMICVEGNAMSQDIRERFKGLRKISPNMAVYV